METLRSYLSTLIPADQAEFASRAGTTIGYLRKALSKGQRFDGALVRRLSLESAGSVSLTDLRPDIWPGDEQAAQPQQTVVQQIRGEVDSRMSKRALRARLGLRSDAHLARVLQLPAAEVAAWPEEGSVPAIPQVLKLLGAQEALAAPSEPEDPDADRIVNVEAA